MVWIFYVFLVGIESCDTCECSCLWCERDQKHWSFKGCRSGFSTLGESTVWDVNFFDCSNDWGYLSFSQGHLTWNFFSLILKSFFLVRFLLWIWTWKFLLVFFVSRVSHLPNGFMCHAKHSWGKCFCLFNLRL